MPYITCDGKTYSRYDKSPYVQDCIKKQNEYYDSLFRACTLDPACRAEREQESKNLMMLGVFFFFLIAIILFLLFREMNKPGKP